MKRARPNASWIQMPKRDLGLLVLLVGSFGLDFLSPIHFILPVAAALAVLPTLWEAAKAVAALRISIDVFNAFAIVVSFILIDFRSAGFIALMLVNARLLEWRTASRTQNAVEELLKLKPEKAVRERNGKVEDVTVSALRKEDILLISQGSRVPADGIIIHGTAYVNESSVTGESVPVRKTVGDAVISATLVESGSLKFRATHVGKESTLERMAALMREAASHKSQPEKLADRFATIFLPIVAVAGLVTYLVTRDLKMTAALFLVACADDMAVAIPLAMTASLGQAAKRGVILKGGEWLDALARIQTLVLDKTGTLTYGALAIHTVRIAPGIAELDFWRFLAIAEKYSEHPVGRAAFHEAAKRVQEVPDPDETRVHVGAGISVTSEGHQIAVGNERMSALLNLSLPPHALSDDEATDRTRSFLFVDGAYAGMISIADQPRSEARKSIRDLRRLGISKIIMLTGDHLETAARIAKTLGLKEFHASLSPEEKLRTIERLPRTKGTVAMIGDGINDAPALARADVGIAMGGGGTAVASEAADVIILTDDLSRIPEMITLGRRTGSVIRTDMGIWFVSNIFGFLLVWMGIAGPALAAFYNFATDFLPLLNSSRLFRKAH